MVFAVSGALAVSPAPDQVHVTGLVGTAGSSLAVWTVEESGLNIHICLGQDMPQAKLSWQATHKLPGHDCLDQARIGGEVRGE